MGDKTALVYQRAIDAVVRQIGDDAVFVPMEPSLVEAGDLFLGNETAARVWELLDGRRSLGEIIQVMADEYDARAADLERDVGAFIEVLLAENLVKEVAVQPARD